MYFKLSNIIIYNIVVYSKDNIVVYSKDQILYSYYYLIS